MKKVIKVGLTIAVLFIIVFGTWNFVVYAQTHRVYSVAYVNGLKEEVKNKDNTIDVISSTALADEVRNVDFTCQMWIVDDVNRDIRDYNSTLKPISGPGFPYNYVMSYIGNDNDSAIKSYKRIIKWTKRENIKKISPLLYHKIINRVNECLVVDNINGIMYDDILDEYVFKEIK